MPSIDEAEIPRVGTVAHAFCTLDEQIKALPEYARALFAHVRKRLESARNQHEDAPAYAQHSRVSNRFVEAVSKLVSLLAPYGREIFAGHVTKRRWLEKRLREVHEILDSLFRELKTDERGDWVPIFKAAMNAYTKALKSHMDSQALRSELERTNNLYLETVMILKRARNTGDADQWDELAQRLFRVMKFLDVPHDALDANVPPWFVPVMDVTYFPEPFAQGAFGAVHLGEWGSGAKVVVKILLDPGHLGSALLDAFLREANLWYQFTHPHCARMFGASHVSSPPFILCEEAKHGNLADFLARKDEHKESNRATKVWRRLFEAALGLEYLHNKGVVHRDLKLNNVLVGADGYTRIADFGLSSVKNASTSNSASTAKRKDGTIVVGTMRWRAPECFKEEPSQRSDIFSFGMCIYEAFAGEPPFAHLDDGSAKGQIVAGALLERPTELTHDSGWELVQEMTKKEPSERIELKEAIATLKPLANDEAAAERKKFVLCVMCQSRLVRGTKNCATCKVDVGTKPLEREVIRIGSSRDLARIVNLLEIGTDDQKKGCLEALLEYVFGDPLRQRKVHDAGAIPVLTKLLDEMLPESPTTYPVADSPEDEILIDALLTLGSIYAVNALMQHTAAFDGAIPVLEKALKAAPDGGDERRRAKAAMAIGLLADSHPANRELVPPEVVDTIHGFARSAPPVLRKAGKQALHHLGAAPPAA